MIVFVIMFMMMMMMLMMMMMNVHEYDDVDVVDDVVVDDDEWCAFRHSTFGELQKMQPFHDLGAEQRQGCTEHVGTIFLIRTSG